MSSNMIAEYVYNVECGHPRIVLGFSWDVEQLMEYVHNVDILGMS